MGTVLSLKTVASQSRASLPAMLHEDPWLAAPLPKRNLAQVRAAYIQPWASWGGSANTAAVRLYWDGQAGRLPQAAQNAYALLGKAPSVVTIKRWLLGHAKQGLPALLDERAGRACLPQDWHHQAVLMYNRGSKPSYAAVAKELQAMGYDSAVEHKVARYLKALPTRLGKNGPARIGPALHKLTLQKYQRRTLDNLRPGDAYVGDGHTIDVYLAHPNTGKLWRPELSFFLDLKSRLPVGWWLGNSENTIDTLRALGHAIATHDHVPPMLYLDHGPGYRSKMMSGEAIGFAAQMGIDLMAARPGNPHGKGWVESFFRTVRDEHDKFFAAGEFYCGGDMAPEINRRLSVEVATGKRKLPTLWDYQASLAAFFGRLAARPMEALDGATRLAVWQQGFVRIPAVYPVAELIRPMLPATVRRQTVTLHKRTHYHAALIDWQGQRVRVRYDLHDDQHVWVYDEKNRLICQAVLASKVAAIPSSRIEEARDTATRKSVERMERHIDEERARRRDPITAESQIAAIDALIPSLPAMPLGLAAPAEDDFEVDLTTWRKDT